MTPEQLRAKALRMGAEVTIGGKTFNAQRRQMTPMKPTEKPVAAPVEEPEDDDEAPEVTAEQVQAMLAQRDAAWASQMAAQIAALEAKIAGAEAKNAALSSRIDAMERAAGKRPSYTVKVKYDGDGDIDTLVLKPDSTT